jgi:hypothetical protein
MRSAPPPAGARQWAVPAPPEGSVPAPGPRRRGGARARGPGGGQRVALVAARAPLPPRARRAGRARRAPPAAPGRLAPGLASSPPPRPSSASPQAPRPAQAAKAALAAGAASLLLAGGPAAPALANEFDILGEPTPTNAYYVDDAGVLSKSTKSAVNKKLRLLEVRPMREGGGACARG